MSEDLLKKIHPEAESPYAGLDLNEHPNDIQGWASNDPVFEEVISKVRPRLVVEVGTWKGASAAHVAKLMKRYCDSSARIICVDTWLGSPEHFLYLDDPTRRPSLRLKNGFPQLYYTFLCNMVRQKVDDMVIPLPQPSINGAIIIRSLGLRPDVIYIDAGHDYKSVLADLRAFWPLLSDDGVLIGDDFISHPTVTKAAYDFSREVGVPLVGMYSKFVLSKNKALQPRIVQTANHKVRRPMTGANAVDRLLPALQKKEKEYISAFAASGDLERLGAGNYYLSRLQHEALVPAPEWDVLKFILRSFPVTAHIVEIGCGWGQMLAMAAAAGYRCTGIDVNASRLEGAKYLRRLVGADFKGSNDRLRYVQAEFPVSWTDALGTPSTGPKGVTIGFFSNLGIGKPEEFCDLCVAEFRHFDYVIIDLVRFFTDRLDKGVQDAFIEKLYLAGIVYCGDIHYSPRAYRFIVLSVVNPPPLLAPRIELRMASQPLIDLATTTVLPARATVDRIDEVHESPAGVQVMRVKEDDTAGTAHDIRLFHQGRAKDGRYELTASLRAGERRAVCILLHRNWGDHVRIMIDVAGGEGQIANVLGSTFQPSQLKVEKSGDWTQVNAQLELKGEPENVGISVHLVNEAKQYYYDGDGCSALDIGALRLAGVTAAGSRL